MDKLKERRKFSLNLGVTTEEPEISNRIIKLSSSVYPGLMKVILDYLEMSGSPLDISTL